MQNFVYSGGLSGGLLRHVKNGFFSLFQNEVRSVLNIKESYSMEKSLKNVSKISHRNFIKRGGGGQRPFINFIKKTGILVRDGFPYFAQFRKDSLLHIGPNLGTLSVRFLISKCLFIHP